MPRSNNSPHVNPLASSKAAGADKLSAADAQTILSLRLLIARAANKDSLRWWDDNSLTESAGFIFGRIFPTAPTLAARNLALRAAQARHDAARINTATALHLYRLDRDNRDQLSLAFWPLQDIPVPSEPVASLEDLQQRLLDITSRPMTYEVIGPGINAGLQIKIPPSAKDVSLLVHRAQTLAWAYLEGEADNPCLPYCLE